MLVCGVFSQCRWEFQFKQCFALVVGLVFNVVGNRSLSKVFVLVLCCFVQCCGACVFKQGFV